MSGCGKDLPVLTRELRNPKAVTRQPPPGCSRSPTSWTGVTSLISEVCDDASLQFAWDAVLSNLELEMLNRYDWVGPAAQLHLGRTGK
eukprot:7394648-Pyramimonas_sp.AAC.1